MDLVIYDNSNNVHIYRRLKMLEIGLNKRTLVINGEKIEVSNEMVHWLQKNTQVVITYKLEDK